MDPELGKEKLKIAVIGTGLVGCSMADGLRDASEEITGVDSNARNIEEAIYRGWIDKSKPVEKAVEDADLVIISVPVDVTIRMLPDILDLVKSQAVVIDTGSVKSAVCRSVRNNENRDRFVASHPMAGLAVSGPDASDARLFRNRKVLICEHDRSSRHALETAHRVFSHLGMEIVYMDPELHDLYVAEVSHLPQVLAYCLATLEGLNDNKKDLLFSIASSGYESSTRLASSPPAMWVPILRHNKDNLSASVEQMISRLADINKMIREEKWDSLKEVIEKANLSRELFLSAYKRQ